MECECERRAKRARVTGCTCVTKERSFLRVDPTPASCILLQWVHEHSFPTTLISPWIQWITFLRQFHPSVGKLRPGWSHLFPKTCCEHRFHDGLAHDIVRTLSPVYGLAHLHVWVDSKYASRIKRVWYRLALLGEATIPNRADVECS